MSSTSAPGAVCDFRDEFDRQVRALDAKVNSFSIADGEHYARIVREVTEAKCRARKRPLDYRRLKRYDVATAAAVAAVTDQADPLLVLPRDDGERTAADGGAGRRRRYLHNGQLFDALRTSHLDTGHGGLHKMHVDLKHRYANVTRPVIQIFLANCETCRRRRGSNDGGGTRKTVQRPLMERTRVDLVVQHGDPIMVYQDCRTRFVVLRPIGSHTAPEVCDRLTEVFCLFGAPAVLCLSRPDDRAFRDQLADACTSAWPRLRVVWTDGPSSSAAVLKSWRRDGPLALCQYRHNNRFHPDVGLSPFQALFGGGGGVDVVNAAEVDPAEPTAAPDAVVCAKTPQDSRRRSVITRAPAAPVLTESTADTTHGVAAVVAEGDGRRSTNETTKCDDDEDDENDDFSDRSDDANKSVREQCRPAKRVRPDVVVGPKRM